MSYVISKKQFLAPKGDGVDYAPYMPELTDCTVTNINVAFGHPLYNSAMQIYYIDVYKKEVMPIIPDGCVTIVFAIEDKRCTAYLCGVTYEIKKLTLNPDIMYLVFKLSPGVGYSLLGSNLSWIANQCVKANGKFEWADTACEILLKDKSIEELITSVSMIIRGSVLEDDNNYIVNFCAENIINEKGDVKINELSMATGFTARYIGKQFEKYVGISPKLLSQIIKLQTTLKRIREEKKELLVDIALDSGFFDHAHMNRAYKKMLHCSSGEIRNRGFSNIDFGNVDEYLMEDYDEKKVLYWS